MCTIKTTLLIARQILFTRQPYVRILCWKKCPEFEDAPRKTIKFRKRQGMIVHVVHSVV